MRSEKLINVDVATRAKRMAERHGAAEWLQEVEQSVESTPEQEVVGLSDILRGEIELTTRTQGGAPAVVKIPHAILAILVTVGLALVGGGFWLVSTITRLDAKLETISRQQDKLESHLVTQKAYIDAETSKVMFIQGLLTRDQQKALGEYERDHPLPKLPVIRPEQDQ